MKIDRVLAALDLPREAQVNRRIPKKLLIEKGAVSPADRRSLAEALSEIYWHAVLKPATIGVPEYKDSVREYLEIAVLSVQLTPSGKTARLGELVHRAVPYPVFLMIEKPEILTLSLAQKRFAQNEKGKIVLEETIDCALSQASPCSPFLLSMALHRQPRTHLYSLYQGWFSILEALQTEKITGKFLLPETPEQMLLRREALAVYKGLEREIGNLRSQAIGEKQLNRRVELNLEIKRLETERAAVFKNL